MMQDKFNLKQGTLVYTKRSFITPTLTSGIIGIIAKKLSDVEIMIYYGHATSNIHIYEVYIGGDIHKFLSENIHEFDK